MSQPERLSDTIYHDLISPPEIQAIREEVRAFADEFIAPRAYEIAHNDESAENFPRDIFDLMAEKGLFQIPYSAADGGRGLAHPILATAVTCEELAYHSNSIAAIFDVHCILAGKTLEHASPELRKTYLSKVINGQTVGAFATTEPAASTDLSARSVRTMTYRDGDHYVIHGHKRWITNSPVAGFILVLCKSETDGMVLLLVDTDSEGVTVGTPDLKLGNRGQLTADVHFDQVRVPVTHRVGNAGDGLKRALSALALGRIGIGATGVGMAQVVFDHSVQHLKTREAFGQKIGAFQHWQFLMADRATQIENARNLYLKAALRLDQGAKQAEPEAGMAKFYGTELAGDMARDGIQIFGGYGYMRTLSADGSHYKVEEVYRDYKITEIYEGTNEIQRMIVARQIFGKEITG